VVGIVDCCNLNGVDRDPFAATGRRRRNAPVDVELSLVYFDRGVAVEDERCAQSRHAGRFDINRVLIEEHRRVDLAAELTTLASNDLRAVGDDHWLG
jgi:hypothetical protein